MYTNKLKCTIAIISEDEQGVVDVIDTKIFKTLLRATMRSNGLDNTTEQDFVCVPRQMTTTFDAALVSVRELVTGQSKIILDAIA